MEKNKISGNALGLQPTRTEITQFGQNVNSIPSKCLAIEITNQSEDLRDPTTGASIGWRLYINNSRVLLPGQSWSNGQLFGYIDDTTYIVSFKPVTGTTGKPLGCVAKTLI